VNTEIGRTCRIMIKNIQIPEEDVDSIHFHDHEGRHREITYVYRQGRRVWELIIGFLYSLNGFSLNSKDGYILKAKNQ
jgi:hypothetical protein